MFKNSCNRKNIKLFSLIVQYFYIENEIQNKLLDFYEDCDESANGMFDAINSSLSHHNFSFDKVSGLIADNTNTNFRIHRSLYRNIEQVNTNLLVKENCHVHIVISPCLKSIEKRLKNLLVLLVVND